MIATKPCDCGIEVTRTVAEGFGSHILNGLPFLCPECSAVREAESTEQRRLEQRDNERAQLTLKLDSLPIALRGIRLAESRSGSRAERTGTVKPTECQVCGVGIEQKQLGRPRQYCNPCGVDVARGESGAMQHLLRRERQTKEQMMDDRDKLIEKLKEKNDWAAVELAEQTLSPPAPEPKTEAEKETAAKRRFEDDLRTAVGFPTGREGE